MDEGRDGGRREEGRKGQSDRQKGRGEKGREKVHLAAKNRENANLTNS